MEVLHWFMKLPDELNAPTTGYGSPVRTAFHVAVASAHMPHHCSSGMSSLPSSLSIWPGESIGMPLPLFAKPIWPPSMGARVDARWPAGVS